MLTIPSSSMATFSNIDIESQSSPSSRNLSDPSNTAAASSSSAIQRQPGQLKRARRTHAKRTCLSCRTNKVRCELPDLQVPSSLDPLPSEKACHRCNVLNLDCVVYDADRKRARNSITTSTTNKKNNKNTSSTEKKLEDGNDNDQSNNPQGSLDSSTKAERKSTAAPRKQPKQSEYQKQKGKLIQDARPQSLAHILEPFQLFSGENESELPDRSGNGSTALNDSDEDVDQLDESIEAQPNASSQDDSSSAKKNDAHITIKRPPIWLKYHMTPLGLLRTLVARHPGFGSDLPDMDPNLSFREVLLVLKLLPEKLSQRIAAVSEMLFLYFPHLPSLPNLLAQHTSAPTLSSALLLTTIYFISLRQCSGFADTKQLKERLKVYIRQMGIQVMLTLPKSTYAVQALELLASYEPLDLMGIDHDLSSLDKLSVPGESQIVAAIHIAQLLKMNDSIELLRDPNDHIKLETRSKRIEDSLVWFSISSTKSALTSKEPDPNVSSESLETFGNEIVRLSQHSSKERSEDRLRDAGRLGVLHRFRRLKMLHTRWAEIIGCYYPTDRPLNEAIRDADSLLEKFGSESIELEYERHLALAPFLQDPRVEILRNWLDYESSHCESKVYSSAVVEAVKTVLPSDEPGPKFLKELRDNIDISAFALKQGGLNCELAEKTLSSLKGLSPSDGQDDSKDGGVDEELQERDIKPGCVPSIVTIGYAIDTAKTLFSAQSASREGWKMNHPRTELHLQVLELAISFLPRLDQGSTASEGNPAFAAVGVLKGLRSTIVAWQKQTFVNDAVKGGKPKAGAVTERVRGDETGQKRKSSKPNPLAHTYHGSASRHRNADATSASVNSGGQDLADDTATSLTPSLSGPGNLELLSPSSSSPSVSGSHSQYNSNFSATSQSPHPRYPQGSHHGPGQHSLHGSAMSSFDDGNRSNDSGGMVGNDSLNWLFDEDFLDSTAWASLFNPMASGVPVVLPNSANRLQQGHEAQQQVHIAHQDPNQAHVQGQAHGLGLQPAYHNAHASVPQTSSQTYHSIAPSPFQAPAPDQQVSNQPHGHLVTSQPNQSDQRTQPEMPSSMAYPYQNSRRGYPYPHPSSLPPNHSVFSKLPNPLISAPAQSDSRQTNSSPSLHSHSYQPPYPPPNRHFEPQMQSQYPQATTIGGVEGTSSQYQEQYNQSSTNASLIRQHVYPNPPMQQGQVVETQFAGHPIPSKRFEGEAGSGNANGDGNDSLYQMRLYQNGK